jgi:hypothetical protein
MKIKPTDLVTLAQEFAKVLRYNPELVQEDNLGDLALIIEIRLQQAYEAGKNDKPVVDVKDFFGTDRETKKATPKLN